jgi:hypothetical protein
MVDTRVDWSRFANGHATGDYERGEVLDEWLEGEGRGLV